MQGKAGLRIAGLCGAVILTSVGYGMGRKAALKSIGSSMGVLPAGAPLPTIQIEPIQPQEELAAINVASPAVSASSSAEAVSAGVPTEESVRVREIQLALKKAGYDPGSADGRLGPRTTEAIREFQKANGLQPDGKVGPRTWRKLEPHLGAKTASSNLTTD
jgi:peptidoglycan hydrolase-like protein with peptidoglycan-binding domain